MTLNKKQRKQERDFCRKRYNLLSFTEKNAFEELINKRSISLINLPMNLFKLLIVLGLFFIIFSIMAGIDLNLFRYPFLVISNVLFQLILYTIPIAIIWDFIIEPIRISKIRRRLLLKE